MKTARFIIGIIAASSLLACSSSQFVVTKNPRKNNPVNEVSWLKEQKKEFKTTPCRITQYEKEGKTYYEIYKPVEGARDKKTTTLFDESGKSVMSYGGLTPPAHREEVNKFFNDASQTGVVWECTPKDKNVKKEKKEK